MCSICHGIAAAAGMHCGCQSLQTEPVCADHIYQSNKYLHMLLQLLLLLLLLLLPRLFSAFVHLDFFTGVRELVGDNGSTFLMTTPLVAHEQDQSSDTLTTTLSKKHHLLDHILSPLTDSRGTWHYWYHKHSLVKLLTSAMSLCTLLCQHSASMMLINTLQYY